MRSCGVRLPPMAPLRFVCMMREESAPGTASVREATNASALSLVMSARKRFWVFSRRKVGGSWGGIGISGVKIDLSKNTHIFEILKCGGLIITVLET